MTLLPFRRRSRVTKPASNEAVASPETLSDTALVAACGVGDTAALGLLFDRYHGKVFGFVVRLTRGSGEDVEDVVQSTFLTAFEGASSFRGGSTVSTWLLGIALNLWRAQCRAKRRYHPDGQERQQLQSMLVEQAPRHFAESQAIHRDLLARLKPEIEALPEPLLVAFTLCDIEGVSGVDAAAVLDIKIGTLYRRLHDARKWLREAIKAWEARS